MFTNRVLFQTIQEYIGEYDVSPGTNALKIEIEKRRDITEDVYKGD